MKTWRNISLAVSAAILSLSSMFVDGAKAAAPSGWLDLATYNRVAGWAKDPDFSGSVYVHVYVDGRFVKSVLANGYRPDVGGNYGFDTTLSPSLGCGTHTVQVYAIGVRENGQPDGVNPQLSGSPKSPDGQCASQFFPYNYVPGDYLTGGWAREPGINKVTGVPGPMLIATKNANVQAGRMMGFMYNAPSGRKIVRVDFSYDANYDKALLTAGLDYPGKWLHWQVSNLGGEQFASVQVPNVDWVGFGLFVKQNATIRFDGWHFRVRDVRLYLSGGSSPVYGGQIKVSPKMGGALTYFQLNSKDIVNISDCGRLIQIDFGDGSTNPNGNKWNPTQACDGSSNYTGATQVIMNGKDVTADYSEAWEIDGTNTTVVSDRLLDWGGTGRSSYTVKQNVKSTQHSGIYLIEYEVTNWGDPHSSVISFEFPALYLRSDSTDRFVGYVGAQPWKSQPITEWVVGASNPFPLDQFGRATPSERWFGLVNRSHDGVIAYVPAQSLAGPSASVGFGSQFNPQGAPNTNLFNVHYIYALLPAGQTMSFHMYVASGHLETIRPLLQSLP